VWGFGFWVLGLDRRVVVCGDVSGRLLDGDGHLVAAAGFKGLWFRV